MQGGRGDEFVKSQRAQRRFASLRIAHLPDLSYFSRPMEQYIRKLIEGGEGQRLDFKYCISDSRKIARTLSAFSNSDGGRLLIGVRDNGSIAGIRSDEEIYMVDTAAHLYCRPEISYRIKQHSSGEKTIIEVEVDKGTKRPYQAMDEDGRWISWFRHGDQNFEANRVMRQVWRKEERRSGIMVRFGKPEQLLLEHLAKEGTVSLSRFRKLAHISPYKAEAILSNLIVMGTIRMKTTPSGFVYELSDKS